MKDVILKRAWSDSRATIGMITISGLQHDPIFTLENPIRLVTKDNRIPAGAYTCVPYSGTTYKDVYEVTKVKGRTAILIHWGNFEKDTEGCILLGDGSGMLNGAPAITASKLAFERFKKLIGSQSFLLTIVD